MRWFPNPRNDARHTRIHRSRAHRAARPDRGRGGIAASDARRSDDAAPGKLRISGVPWVFSREFIVFGWALFSGVLLPNYGLGRAKAIAENRRSSMDVAGPGLA